MLMSYVSIQFQYSAVYSACLKKELSRFYFKSSQNYLLLTVTAHIPYIAIGLIDGVTNMIITLMSTLDIEKKLVLYDHQLR